MPISLLRVALLLSFLCRPSLYIRTSVSTSTRSFFTLVSEQVFLFPMQPLPSPQPREKHLNSYFYTSYLQHCWRDLSTFFQGLAIIKPPSDDALIPSARCLLLPWQYPWHLPFAQLLTMLSVPTTENNRFLKGKNTPNFQTFWRLLSFHPASLISLRLADHLFLHETLFVVPLGCVGSPPQLWQLAWISSCTQYPAPDSIWSPDLFPLTSSSTFNASTSPWGDSRISTPLPVFSWSSQNLTGERNLQKSSNWSPYPTCGIQSKKVNTCRHPL